jgi:EAL domain-containing protein (putative c-di-GMP-specific phosphodiesterase class I)
MGDRDRVREVLEELHRLGVTVTVDDFGTGPSSLVQLRRLALDGLKIDRSFVDGVGIDPEDDAVVGGVVALARSLGLRVVAEGVETQRQLDELRRLGCDGAQGYLFARPATAERIVLGGGEGDVESAPSAFAGSVVDRGAHGAILLDAVEQERPV